MKEVTVAVGRNTLRGAGEANLDLDIRNWRLFASDAQSRAAFPGVAAFYNALHDGPSGSEMNPVLYVSRGPWGIYDMLDAFFNEHGIPIGPILFLREWNVGLTSPLPRRAEGHKKDLVRNMLSLYDQHPFVLIGDSGQHDPEIYADIVREHPDRVKPSTSAM